MGGRTWPAEKEAMTYTLLRITLAAALAAGAALAQTHELAVFTVPFSPSSAVPPAEGFPIGGEGAVLVHMTRDSSGVLTRALVDFRLTFATEQPMTITRLHMHRGERATKGPVAINAELGPEVSFDPGSHHLFRQRILVDQDSLDAIERLLANPSGHYINVHAASHPDGIMRGQLMRTDGAAIAALQDRIDDLTETNAGLAAELADVKTTLARIARRLGVVPAE